MDLFNRFKDTSVYEKQDNGASVLMVELTLVQAAAAKGAVCLDGLVPGYHLYRGYGSGANNWIIHLQAAQLQFRGKRIFLAVMEDLMAKEMRQAKQVTGKMRVLDNVNMLVTLLTYEVELLFSLVLVGI
ncbi:hypothetical protein F2Q69_00050886 [Brassica cretica]|uniref:Pectin acetylesterase n=1 Tax=Brassica cretica TaxID=69181 RepID=A0A8S9Q1D7_BRACR|nr:hypothetical protein F2Q69_00050886 [Brassica cretica]